MRPPRRGMYIVLGLVVAAVVVGVARLAFGGDDGWSAATWALCFSGTFVAVEVVLYILGSASRARTERRFSGPLPPLGPGPGPNID